MIVLCVASMYIGISLTACSIRYTQNGILHMLERNKRIKAYPERFQDSTEEFDVIFTVEERIYDAVLEGVCPAPVIKVEISFTILTFSPDRFRGSRFQFVHTSPSDQLGCQRQP